MDPAAAARLNAVAHCVCIAARAFSAWVRWCRYKNKASPILMAWWVLLCFLVTPSHYMSQNIVHRLYINSEHKLSLVFRKHSGSPLARGRCLPSCTYSGQEMYGPLGLPIYIRMVFVYRPQLYQVYNSGATLKERRVVFQACAFHLSYNPNFARYVHILNTTITGDHSKQDLWYT